MSVVVIVLLCILLIIVIALFMSVTVSFSAGEELRVKVKYAGIPIFELSPEKKQKQKEKRRKTAANPKALAKQKKAEEKKKLKAAAKKEKKERQKKEKPKRSLYQTLELVKALVSSAGKPIKRLFSHIRLTDVIADIVVSGDDAAEAALNYGKLNAVIHSLLQLLYSTVRLSVERIDINVDFQSQKTKYFISFKLKLRLSTALGCALWYVFRAAKRIIAAKNEVGAENTAAEKGK